MQTTAGNAATFPGIVPRLRLHKHKQDSGAGVKKVAVSEVYHVEPVFAAIAAAAGLAGSTDDERALVSMLSAECEYIREALFAQPFYRDTKLSEFKAKEAQMAWCDEFLLPELSGKSANCARCSTSYTTMCSTLQCMCAALTKVLGTNTFFLGDEVALQHVSVGWLVTDADIVALCLRSLLRYCGCSNCRSCLPFALYGSLSAHKAHHPILHHRTWRCFRF